jgi:hypothetical protein
MLVLAVADSVGHIPDDATRRRLAELAARTAGDIKRQAIVIRAEGFGASAVRSIVTAVFAMSRSDYDRRVFGDVNSACDWLACDGRTAIDLKEAFDAVADGPERSSGSWASGQA